MSHASPCDPGLARDFAPRGLRRAARRARRRPRRSSRRRRPSRRRPRSAPTTRGTSRAFSEAFLGALVHDVNAVHGRGSARPGEVIDAFAAPRRRASPAAPSSCPAGGRWHMAWMLNAGAGRVPRGAALLRGRRRAGRCRSRRPTCARRRPTCSVERRDGRGRLGAPVRGVLRRRVRAPARALLRLRACIARRARRRAGQAAIDVELLDAAAAARPTGSGCRHEPRGDRDGVGLGHRPRDGDRARRRRPRRRRHLAHRRGGRRG